MFLDYSFLTEGGVHVKHADAGSYDPIKLIKIANMVDQASGAVVSTVVEVKGAKDAYCVQKFSQWIDRCGFKKVILTTDNENAVKALARKIKEKTTTCEMIIRGRPTGSSASLASGEQIQQVIAGMTRTLCKELEDRSDTVIKVDSNVLPWIVHHCAFVRSRFNKSSDGTTPYYRLNGAHYHGHVVPFGEVVMIRIGDEKEKKKFRPKWRKGIFLGKSEFNDSCFVGTKEDGVVQGRTMHRLPDKPFEKDRVHDLVGVPWDPKRGLAAVADPDIPALGPPAAPPVAGPGLIGRARGTMM